MSDKVKTEDAPAVRQEEYAKPARRRGFIGHLLRFWWLYLIAIIIIIVVAVILLIFVAIPHIAQSKINGTTLTIQGITVLQTQSYNYSMSINSTITGGGGVSATIESFTGQMYLEDLQPHTPFAAVTFPATTSADTVTVNVTNQFTPITDMDAFTVFNTWLLVNDTLRVTVTGDTYIKVSGISKQFPVTFTKTITMPGLRNFNGTTVSDASISLQPNAQGTDFSGFVSVPNYSLVTFEIGNASFNNYLDGVFTGIVYIDNMLLVAGQFNNFSMHANITQSTVLQALTQQPYCTNGGVIPFQLLGNNVTNNGQYLSYYANALGSQNQTVNIGIGATLKQDLNTTIPCSNSTS